MATVGVHKIENGEVVDCASLHHTAPAASPVIETVFGALHPAGSVCAAVVMSISADLSEVGADHVAVKVVPAPPITTLLRLAVNPEVEGGTGVFVGVGV